MNQTLKELYESKGRSFYVTDKQSHHNYLTTYGELFAKWKNEPINILEVGVYKGGSLRLWEDYFTQVMNIIGYDIQIYEGSVQLSRAKVIIKDFSLVTAEELPDLTIAIDDGAHDLESQMMFLEKVYPKVVAGGIIIIEDIFTKDLEKAKERFNSFGVPYEIVSFFPPKDEDNDNLFIWRK